MAEPIEGPGDFLALTRKISRDRGFGCASYKEKCLRRRIAVRMRARGVHTYHDYAQILDTDGAEYDRLLDALTINVTKLFRNWEAYASLAATVIPELWHRESPTIRVWSAGCSSGDEPYSLGILFHRYAAVNGMLSQLGRVRIIGTDIDRQCLDAAERGQFERGDFADTPDELRHRYFGAAAPHTVAPAIRAYDDVRVARPAECGAAARAVRPRRVPQRAHLLRSRHAGAVVRHVPRRARAGRIPDARKGRDAPRKRPCAVRAGRRPRTNLSQTVTGPICEIRVRVADYAVAATGTITTIGLGSCVAITLYDAVVRVGGLAHVLLPSETMSRDRSNPAKFPGDRRAAAALRDDDDGRARRAHSGEDRRRREHVRPDCPGGINIGERNVIAVRETLAGREDPDRRRGHRERLRPHGVPPLDRRTRRGPVAATRLP